jgi:O-antigen/teichoic acid export membrane protein
MGYILIAKGHSRLFVKTSLFFNSAFLIINIAGFHFYGLEGLGITFLINYAIHLLGLKIITAKKYGFDFDGEFYRLFFICIFICGIAFAGLYIESFALKYGMLSILMLISLWFSFTQLNKRIHFKDFFTKGK